MKFSFIQIIKHQNGTCKSELSMSSDSEDAGKIDAFGRKIKRCALGVYYPDRISNAMLESRLGGARLSVIIKRRQLRLVGHLVRGPIPPIRQAFFAAAGKHKGRLLLVRKQISKSLPNTSPHIALDRQTWRDLVNGWDEAPIPSMQCAVCGRVYKRQGWLLKHHCSSVPNDDGNTT